MKRKINALVCLVLSVAMVCNLAGCSKTDKETAEGRAYIEELESQDPATVEATLKESARQKRLQEREERMAKLQSGEISVWSLFEDYCVLGDSRAADFASMSELSPDRIFGGYGETINKIPEQLEKAKAINPSYIFAIFGLNDIRWWDDPQVFAEAYREKLEYIQQQMPNAKIFVNSIFPCTEPALTKHPEWKNISVFNDAVREMVSQTSCYFVTNDNIQSLSGYWRKDGVHFTKEFYTLWGINLIMAVYDAEEAASESAAESAAQSSGEGAQTAPAEASQEGTQQVPPVVENAGESME